MKITAIETYWTQTPFDMGGKPKALGGLNWQSMNTVWLRVITDSGIDGWGEAFGHATAAGSFAVLDTQLAPAVLGQDARDIAGLRHRLAQMFHLYGCNGPHAFALSALDIALWDIAGKSANQPLWRLLGGTPTETLTSYASLLRYGDLPRSPPHAKGRPSGATATSSCTKLPFPKLPPAAMSSATTRD